MSRKLDLSGRRFARWRVHEFAYRDSETGIPYWTCECTCGKFAFVHHLYGQWRGMIARCHNPSDRNYRWWGARGIKVCKRWHDFDLWLGDMEPTWSKGMTIERIDVNGHYEPHNVRWATQAEQATNTRRNIYLDSPWGRLTARQCALKLGINVAVFMQRVHRGWPPEKLFSSQRWTRWGPR